MIKAEVSGSSTRLQVAAQTDRSPQ